MDTLEKVLLYFARHAPASPQERAEMEHTIAEHFRAQPGQAPQKPADGPYGPGEG